MKDPLETANKTAADLIADLEDEAAALQRKNFILELEVKNLRRDLRRARRNPGYRVVNNISRALKPISRLLKRNGAGDQARFPRPAARAGNGSAFPCSTELTKLIRTLAPSLRTSFFTSSTARNWVLHKTLGSRNVRTSCFRLEQVTDASAQFFAVPEKAFGTAGVVPAFVHQDLVVIDCHEPGPLWPWLQGRLWPHQKVLVHGKGIPEDPQANQGGADFAFYAAPPASWLDPRHEYLPVFAPWKSSRRRLAATLPSGRAWPKISVITPSFNQGKYIPHTLESVLGQNYPKLEYMVLDGGSTDETRSILDVYRPRLAYSCSQRDNGQADAINKGFQRATGDILAWLNSDDQYPLDALMCVALAFDLFPEADLVVGGCGLLQGNSAVPSRIHHSALPIGRVVPLPLMELLDLENCWLKGNFFYQPEVFWRRGIWEAAGGRVDDDLYYCFDYDLWVRMAQAGARVVHIPDLLALYRVHPNQKTYGDNLPYLPELKLLKGRHDPSSARHETTAKA